ncbi:tRNA-dihydrouridine synthase [Candidatus Beckwithbacteria bacterium]|nr:tRNA-dihydrouridine synthase [Candidatus Beckwithbacteria bacterium]
MHFWQNLPKPIIGLSPMDGITDEPFRQIVTKISKPDLIITEFVHVQGLWCGKMPVFQDFLFDEIERPIVAQIFGNEPDYFYKAAHIVAELGFDGIDLNMGCPANKIIKKGGGASLIKTPKLAQEIIKKTKQGVNDWYHGQTLQDIGLASEKITYIEKFKKNKNKKLLPVSTKTRIGFEQNIIKEWIKYLLEAKPDAIIVHGRTLKQLYGGQADWEAIASVSHQVKQAQIIYLGNGDVKNRQDGEKKCKDYQVDGVLIGRQALGNPWVFDKNPQKISPETKLETLLQHTKLQLKIRGEKNFIEMRKHFGWYCKDFDGAKQLRIKLLETKNLTELETILKNFLTKTVTMKIANQTIF